MSKTLQGGGKGLRDINITNYHFIISFSVLSTYNYMHIMIHKIQHQLVTQRFSSVTLCSHMFRPSLRFLACAAHEFCNKLVLNFIHVIQLQGKCISSTTLRDIITQKITMWITTAMKTSSLTILYIPHNNRYLKFFKFETVSDVSTKQVSKFQSSAMSFLCRHIGILRGKDNTHTNKAH